MYNYLHASTWKKHLRIVNTVRNFVSNSVLSIRFWIRPTQICIRYWPVWFNFHDLFFIRYFKQKDNHYARDLIPVLKRWCNLSTTLEFHVSLRSQSFRNMFMDIIQTMRYMDHSSVARRHLSGYHYFDYRSFDLLVRDVRRYNDMVRVFINHVTERIEIYLKTELPYLQEYASSNDQQSNVYYYSGIVYYFWLVYWQSRDGRHETKPEIIHYGGIHDLRIDPSREPIALADSEDDIRKLQTFLNELTPDVVDWLTRLNHYRNEVIEHYNIFRQNIERILEDQSWTRPVKGRCGWEQQYFSVTDNQ